MSAKGWLSLILHAHLPYVRHPEHAKFLEENWLFEAITESYLPLIEMFEGWRQDGIQARLTVSLSPTLCSMFRDELLQERCSRYLEDLIELAEKETFRTTWQPQYNQLANLYLARFRRLRAIYVAWKRDLVQAFRHYQEQGHIEIITTAATHAILPLLANHPPAVRGQILVARDYHRECFGCDPRGVWLPECAYVEGIEEVLREANLRWFIVEAHGILHARPRPRYAIFAPIITPNGLAAFGRDLESAKQVWSRDHGYPGDPRYREFYRDIGFDLDFDYVEPFMGGVQRRTFTGIKYHRITGASSEKLVYDPPAAERAADEHAGHFMAARIEQVKRLSGILGRPPLVVSPYDAELFGHWWYEGPRFLDYFVRKAYFDQDTVGLTTPEEYLTRYPVHQVSTPAPSSWGEGGYWGMWLNESNEWLYRHLSMAQERMTDLARKFQQRDGLQRRALRQAARELLLAQASDWAFILRAGTSPDYARQRAREHLQRFTALYEQLSKEEINQEWLAEVEWRDKIFENIQPGYWA